MAAGTSAQSAHENRPNCRPGAARSADAGHGVAAAHCAALLRRRRRLNPSPWRGRPSSAMAVSVSGRDGRVAPEGDEVAGGLGNGFAHALHTLRDVVVEHGIGRFGAIDDAPARTERISSVLRSSRRGGSPGRVHRVGVHRPGATLRSARPSSASVRSSRASLARSTEALRRARWRRSVASSATVTIVSTIARTRTSTWARARSRAPSAAACMIIAKHSNTAACAPASTHAAAARAARRPSSRRVVLPGRRGVRDGVSHMRRRSPAETPRAWRSMQARSSSAGAPWRRSGARRRERARERADEFGAHRREIRDGGSVVRFARACTTAAQNPRSRAACVDGAWRRSVPRRRSCRACQIAFLPAAVC